MIQSDGSTIGVNMDYNGTGACVGGFSGFESGKDLMDSAVNASSSDLSYNSDNFSKIGLDKLKKVSDNIIT